MTAIILKQAQLEIELIRQISVQTYDFMNIEAYCLSV